MACHLEDTRSNFRRPCSASYSPWVGANGGQNPCAVNPGCAFPQSPSVDSQAGGFSMTNASGFSSKGFNYTNNSSAPQLITFTNGAQGTPIELQPGQGTTVPITVPFGATNGGFNVNTLNNYGNLQDAGGDGSFTLTNQGAPNWQFQPSSYSNSPLQNIGANGMDLASSNGGPIIWSTNMTMNQDLQAGFNQLANGQNQNEASMGDDFSNLLARLNKPLQVQFSNSIPSGSNSSGLASNVWVQNWPSNFAGSGSNVWVQNFPLTNSGYGSNQALAMINTNQAFGVLTPMNSAIATITGQLPSTLADDTGGGHEEDIVLGNPSGPNVTLAVGTLPSGMSSSYVHLRNLIAWLTVLTLLMWNSKTMFEAIRDVLLVQGAEGADTGTLASAVGGNAMTAIITAAAILTAVSVIPTLAVGFFSSELTFWSGTENPQTFFGAMGWQYSWVSQYIPIAVFVTALGSRIAFWFVIEVIKTILEAVAKALVGM